MAYLISGVTYGFSAAVSPGPLSMYLVSQAVARGWRKAVPIAFSPLLTDAPVAVIVLAILSRVPGPFVSCLRLLGGVLLFGLAVEAWRAYRNFAINETSNNDAPNSLLRAVGINWLNPNVYIAWSVILGPLILSGWRQSPANGVAMIVGFYTTFVIVMAGMAFVFGSTQSLGPRVRRTLSGISALALAGLGLYQFYRGISALAFAM